MTVETEFTAFVAERSHALVRVAYALTGDQRAAEDLVQGALAKAYARWPRIRGEAEPYVRRIIYNDRASGWRHRARLAELTMAELPDRPAPGSLDHDATVRLVLRQALLALPPRQRAVLVLRYLEDRSIEETAEVLGCRPGTVASQAARGLAKLRELVPELDLAAEVLR
ncbi:SigE family RNA polymerase sigma factor [Winogradskya humida]|uniref:DNA-directed RNA polymerase sigma-70 factor n=1 Tax=Winogradskya humida TaxID=113566 RepID=A0ABQ3ZNI5_9ACTN|nr:SigE family RNA polymerase sigma factor [Actinoplanes humidus]GIE20113.1 DNA-directed RNA polymerase sigma-70 factor [Actinoplanes humidus]